MFTLHELGLMVGAAVGAGGLASVAVRFLRRPQSATVVIMLLATSLAAVVTAIILFRTVLV